MLIFHKTHRNSTCKMEAGALSEEQAKIHALESLGSLIPFYKGSFGREIDTKKQINSTLTEESPRAMQDDDQEQDQEQEQQNVAEGVEENFRSVEDEKIDGQGCARTPVETSTNEENARTNSEEHTEVQEEKSRGNEDESTSTIEKGQNEVARSEDHKEQSMAAKDKAKIEEKEQTKKKKAAMAKEERKLKEKQIKEEKQRAKLNLLLEEARSNHKMLKLESKESKTPSQAKVQAAAEKTGKKLKKIKKSNAAKWRVDSVQMEEDVQQFLDGIKALESKQREQDRQEAEEAAAIVLDDEHINGWKAVLKELSQTTSFSAATASLSVSQLSSAPRTVVLAILRRAAKMEYKNQLKVLKETYYYRMSLLKKLKTDMKSNFKSEAQELRAAYKKSRAPSI